MNDVLAIIRKRWGARVANDAARSLARYLPASNNWFEVVRCGNNYGMRIVCPYCAVTPPKTIKGGSRRWRWMTVHVLDDHDS
jgi:hypothetical protein